MNFNERKDILFVCFLFSFILILGLFNFIVDPYSIFKKAKISSFNNVKTHKFSDRRNLIYSDIKINSKDKTTVFTGNCLLSEYSKLSKDVYFYTLPIVRISEVPEIIKNIHKIAPNIKTFYWGIFYDDLLNDFNPLVNNSSINFDTNYLTMQDFVNLLFSWNTTKYSIETVCDSLNADRSNIKYVYPFRELKRKEYSHKFSLDNLSSIKDILDWSNTNNIKLVIYYSPIHISKKIYLYGQDLWNDNLKFKEKLAEITPFYDYSLANEYNNSVLDENSKYYIDNIHPTSFFNRIVVTDLLSSEKKLGVLIDKQNVSKFLVKDTKDVIDYMQTQKQITSAILNVDDNSKMTKILLK